MIQDICDLRSWFVELASWEVGRVREMEPAFVRRRIEFVLEVCAEGSVGRMARETGIPRNVLNHALSKGRMSFSPTTAVLIYRAYGVHLNFFWLGERQWLPEKLQRVLDQWIVEGRWSIEDGAPTEDRSSEKES